MSCEKNCENKFNSYINDLINNGSDMSLYLVNGIRLDGKIVGYDCGAKCIWLSNSVNENKPQVIFLNAVSTISFAKFVANKFNQAVQVNI